MAPPLPAACIAVQSPPRPVASRLLLARSEPLRSVCCRRQRQFQSRRPVLIVKADFARTSCQSQHASPY
eukprot:6206730-Pleurochrysis_carterae.AAC.2